MKNIYILSDGAGWVVDRAVDEMVRLMSPQFKFTRDYYTRVTTDKLIETANKSDLTYYANWDFGMHMGAENLINTPFLLGVKSFRFPPYLYDLNKKFYLQVNNPKHLEIFPDAYWIAEGVFDMFKPDHPFRVGMAFAESSREYKGYYLVKDACDQLGVELVVASGNLPPEGMVQFYKSVDLVVIASIDEGFNSIAMECALMNKPFITTNVGIPMLMNCHKMDRGVFSIKSAIEKFYTHPQAQCWSYEASCKKFADLFNKLIEYGPKT
jgi:hypothetical protein